MRLREVEDLVDDRVTAVLTAHGFRRNRALELISRKISAGSQAVGVSVIDYEPDFELSPTFLVRIDDVEAIYHLFSGAAPKSHGLSFTTMTPSEYLSGIEHWEGSDFDGIHEAADEIAAVVGSAGLRFFDEYDNAASLDRAVNTDRLPGFSAMVPGQHARHALILAHVARNPRFDTLVDEYLSAFRDAPMELATLRQVADYLRRLSN